MVFFKPKPPPTQRPTPERLQVRDNTVVCAFFGIYLGVDTRRWPELRSRESLNHDLLERFERGPVSGTSWSLLEFGAYRSALAAVPTWVLAMTSLDNQGLRENDPALPGKWWIDGNRAVPQNAGVLRVTPGMFEPLVVTPESERECAELSAALGIQNPQPRDVGWHIISLVHLKHT